MKILDRLPLLPASQSVRFGQRHVRFHRDSMVVWLSVALSGEQNSQRISAVFPALLDSGNNSTVYLHEHHLLHWAGFQRNACASGEPESERLRHPFPRSGCMDPSE